MRRIVLSLLVVLFSFPLITPFLLANSSPHLPACCRVNGKHHCAITEKSAHPHQSAFQSKCPFVHQTQYLACTRSDMFVAAATRLRATLIVTRAAPTAIHSSRNSLFANTAQQRGPPSSVDNRS